MKSSDFEISCACRIIEGKTLSVTSIWGEHEKRLNYKISPESIIHHIVFDEFMLESGLYGRINSTKIEIDGLKLEDGIDVQGNVVPAVICHNLETGHVYYKSFFNDGRQHDPESGEAADQTYNDKTGKIKNLTHYFEGAIHSPERHIPAIQAFDGQTGLPRSRTFYQFGKKNDPAPNVPAFEDIWSDTGKVHGRAFYKMDLLHDPENGEAASQDFDIYTGALIRQTHYNNGVAVPQP